MQFVKRHCLFLASCYVAPKGNHFARAQLFLRTELCPWSRICLQPGKHSRQARSKQRNDRPFRFKVIFTSGAIYLLALINPKNHLNICVQFLCKFKFVWELEFREKLNNIDQLKIVYYQHKKKHPKGV